MLPHDTSSVFPWCRIIFLSCIFALPCTLSAQTTRGYLGVEAHDLSPQQLATLKVTQGVEIGQVDTTGPGGKAGLKEHDVVVTFNSQLVADAQQMQSLVQQNPGQLVQIGLLRNGKPITVPVKIGSHDISILTEAQEQAEIFGRAAFAHCDEPKDTYCIGPLEQNRLACTKVLSNPQQLPKTCQLVVQVHATADDPFTFDGTVTELSVAERAQGVTFKGTIRFTGDKVRSLYKADGRFLDWSDWHAVKDPNGRDSVMVAALWKKDGEWLAADLRTTGLLVVNQTTVPTEPSDIAPRQSPNQVMKEAFGLADPLTIKQLVTSIKQLSCEEIFTGKKTAQPSPVQAFTNRVFTGTPDEFAAALPGYVEQASYAMHLEPKNYEKEVDFIIATVRTCAQITPQMYKSFIGTGKRPDFTKFGEQYSICNNRRIDASLQAGHTLAENERGIVLELEAVGGYGQEQRQGFHAVVSFDPRNNDSFRNVAFENYGIVGANVDFSASTPQSPQAPNTPH